MRPARLLAGLILPGFDLLNVAMGQSAVTRCVGVDLSAVQADGAQLEQLHLLRNVENLNKQTGQLVEKGGQRVVVGMRAGCNEAEGH